MVQATISRRANFDDFRAESEDRWPSYIRDAERVLSELTPRYLQNAMLHPDGFVKLAIGPGNGSKDGQLRLHFWLPGRQATWQPHSHPWHLASMVLMGVYREYLPDLRPDASGVLRKFAVAYPPDSDARAGVYQVGTGSFSCERGPVRETKEGNAHYLPAGPVHMSSPDALGAITLAVMSLRFEDRSYFYAPDSVQSNELVTPGDITAVMELVTAARGLL